VSVNSKQEQLINETFDALTELLNKTFSNRPLARILLESLSAIDELREELASNKLQQKPSAPIVPISAFAKPVELQIGSSL
jgi:hypothetical protein